MLYNYKECIEKYGSHYALMKAIKNRELFKIQGGLYSTIENPKELAIFLKKNENVIFTMESAFYYLGISDAIPDKYYIATDRDSTKLNISTVEQYFLKKDILNIGLQKIEHSGINIPIYSKERMLIEVIRYSKRLPYDYYKEIIAYYRNHIYEIDIPLVIEYIEKFPKSELIRDKLEKEVL